MRRDRGRVIAAAVTATAAVALAGLAALVLREPSEPASEPGITMTPAPPDAQASSSFEPETTAASEAPASSGAAERSLQERGRRSASAPCCSGANSAPHAAATAAVRSTSSIRDAAAELTSPASKNCRRCENCSALFRS